MKDQLYAGNGFRDMKEQELYNTNGGWGFAFKVIRIIIKLLAASILPCY